MKDIKTISTCRTNALDDGNANNVTIHKKQPCTHDRIKLIAAPDLTR
jgi:hypothetical protein